MDTQSDRRDIDATTDAESVWRLANLGEAGVAVSFPADFDCFTETDGVASCRVLECFHGDYKKFLVREYVYPDAIQAREKYLKLKENYGFFAERLSESLRDTGPTFEASLANAGECGEVLVVCSKRVVVLLVASDTETPDCPNLASMSRRFFDSLTLIRR